MVKFEDLSEVTVEAIPEGSEWMPGDPFTNRGCDHAPLGHTGKLVEAYPEIGWAIVQYDDRTYTESIQLANISRV